MNPLWKSICDKARSRDRFLDHLPLQCKAHPDTLVKAKCAADFANSPQGGCRRVCGYALPCNHKCELLCHPLSHDMFKCVQTCNKPRPSGCTHKCTKPCWEDCGPCTFRIPKLRSLCGHTIRVNCQEDANDKKCSENCGYVMICGHKCGVRCSASGHDPMRHLCTSPCLRSLCGHPCLKKCHEQCGTSLYSALIVI